MTVDKWIVCLYGGKLWIIWVMCLNMELNYGFLSCSIAFIREFHMKTEESYHIIDVIRGLFFGLIRQFINQSVWP